ncbi:protein KTI12 homolog [Prorops nasuta]|uniref:protein KTI12 homolog n=1 Tax=Prorops nasuta TaxID=863751 RepID=UPI0034D002A4
MPLVIITGIPCSGKTKRTFELVQYFQNELHKNVSVISEMEEVHRAGYEKNSYFSDSKIEKCIRANIKSEVQRLLHSDHVLILDGSNYIKGFRYEIHCLSKFYRTPQCTVFCETPIEHAWLLNSKKDSIDRYDSFVFDALVMRYEPPDNKNRWDTPLFTVSLEDELELSNIHDVLYLGKAPVPNLSTQSTLLSSVDYLYNLDKITQKIINEILAAKQLGVEKEIKISGCSLSVESTGSTAKFLKLRRQFLTYTKMQQCTMDRIAHLFVQYLNKNL